MLQRFPKLDLHVVVIASMKLMLFVKTQIIKNGVAVVRPSEITFLGAIYHDVSFMLVG